MCVFTTSEVKMNRVKKTMYKSRQYINIIHLSVLKFSISIQKGFASISE